MCWFGLLSVLGLCSAGEWSQTYLRDSIVRYDYPGTHSIQSRSYEDGRVKSGPIHAEGIPSRSRPARVFAISPPSISKYPSPTTDQVWLAGDDRSVTHDRWITPQGQLLREAPYRGASIQVPEGVRQKPLILQLRDHDDCLPHSNIIVIQ